MANPIARWWQSLVYGDFPPGSLPAPAAPTPAPAPQPVRESFVAGGYDPDLTLTASQGGSPYYRRLTQTQRDLAPLSLDRAQAIAYHLFDTSPMGRRVTEANVDHVVGDAVTVTSQNTAPRKREAEQVVIDSFWQDPANDMDLRLRQYLIDFALAGELCLRVDINPVNGHVRLGPVDSSVISRVAIDSFTAQPRVVILKAMGGQPEQRYKVICVDQDPRSPSYGRLTGIRTDRDGNILDQYEEDGHTKYYAGACFFWLANSPTFASRGRPDMLPTADFIDGHDALIMNEVDRSALLKSFVWDVELKGADSAAVDARRMELKTAPKPGSVNIHNETETWSAVTPDLKAADAQAAADILISHIATGAGLPKVWLNGVMDSNRATAAEMADPALQRQRAKQKQVRAILTTIVTFALDTAEVAGMLSQRGVGKGGLPEPWPLSISLPELRPRDVAGIGQTFTGMGLALKDLVEAKLIDQTTGRQIVALLAGKLGLEVTAEAIASRVTAELATEPTPTVEESYHRLYSLNGRGA